MLRISSTYQAADQGMVSKGTQTNEKDITIEEKRKLIRKQLGVLLHAVLCRVRDEMIGNTGATASSVSNLRMLNVYIKQISFVVF